MLPLILLLFLNPTCFGCGLGLGEWKYPSISSSNWSCYGGEKGLEGCKPSNSWSSTCTSCCSGNKDFGDYRSPHLSSNCPSRYYGDEDLGNCNPTSSSSDWCSFYSWENNLWACKSSNLSDSNKEMEIRDGPMTSSIVGSTCNSTTSFSYDIGTVGALEALVS